MLKGKKERIQVLEREEGLAEVPDRESATEMIDLYEETFKNLEEGTIIEGRVMSVQPDGVMVDIGYKSEGVVPREEFLPADLEALKPGDPLLVYLEEREDSEGNLILSKEKADKMKIWEDLEKIYESGEVVEGRVISRIKGGMMVDIGVKAFLPGSQIDLRPIRDLDSLIGKNFQMKVIKINHRRGNIVVSRRVLLEETRDKRRAQTLANLEEGQRIQGTVKNITEYGAFIDLGGIDGLLHITDMSWGRVSHPSELFSVGQKVEVVILKYAKDTGRVSLGFKQLLSDPWTHINERYQVAHRVRGKVVSLTDYGAFVELEHGIEGLIHISEMSWTHEVRHPSKIVSIGEEVEVVVLSMDRDNRKISLGMKQTAPNPWDKVEEKYPIGTRVEGKVRSLTDFGAFVGLEDGIDGLIHISDLSWIKHVRHPSEILKKGQKVEVVVLKVDREKERISLGYKQNQEDPWESGIIEKYKVGDTVVGRVVKTADFGVFVELEDGVEGLIHISEANIESGDKIEEALKLEVEVRAKIIRVDPVERKIALSIKEIAKES